MNYERIRTAMEAVGWKWHMPDGSYRVPSVDEMKRCVEGLSEEAWKHPGVDICSGGFQVRVVNERVLVMFVLDSNECDLYVEGES